MRQTATTSRYKLCGHALVIVGVWAVLAFASCHAALASAGARSFAGSSAEGAVSFVVTGSAVTGFQFDNVCPGDSSAGTPAPVMSLSHGRFAIGDGQFSIRGVVSGDRAHGTARDVTGDCSSALLDWTARLAPATQSSVPALAELSAQLPLASVNHLQVSPRELAAMMNFEAYREHAYDHDGQSNGNCTIGFGHLIHKGPCTKADLAKYAGGWSRAVAAEHFASDVQKASACVNSAVSVALNQSQEDALTDFVFNAGCPAFRGSTLLKVLNQGKYTKVGSELKRWVHGERGKVLPGLVRRRGVDAKLFNGGSTEKPPSGPPSPPESEDCAGDDPAQPPSDGCARVRVQVIPSFYPGDTQQGLGVGVGTATAQPGDLTVPCLNPSDAGACVRSTDVDAGTTVTVTATPGSQAPDPQSPADSRFEKFAGGCSGTGSCQITPSSGTTTIDVYFVPAVATLTLNASPSSGPEMSANGEGSVATTDPFSPVYCGGPGDASQLPCSILVRVNGEVQIEADNAGHTELGKTPTFSDNCPTRSAAPTFCDITLTSDQTVTATFGGG